MRIIDQIIKFLTPKDWVEVKFYPFEYHWDSGGDIKVERIYYRLFENQFGDREIKFEVHGYTKMYKSHLTTKLYQEALLTWKNSGIEVIGEIPTYDDIKKLQPKMKRGNYKRKAKKTGNVIHHDFKKTKTN